MKSIRRIRAGWFGLVFLAVGGQAQHSVGAKGAERPLRRDARVEIVASATATPVFVDVEVADEKQEQDRGLMGRGLAGDGEGMLFVYSKAASRIFWMRDTPVSLDILFFDSNRRLVALVPKAEPLSDRLLKSHVPAQYVLEVPGGFADRHAVGLGAEFRLIKSGK